MRLIFIQLCFSKSSPGDVFMDFRERRRERECEREPSLSCLLYAFAWNGDRTCHLSVYGPMLHQLSRPARADSIFTHFKTFLEGRKGGEEGGHITNDL